MQGRIFISYRREDAPGDARGLADRLARQFGKSNVFMDVDHLLAGQRFDRELDKALSQCDVLIAVVGPRWMELFSRTSGERDFVRDEIAAALKRDIVVIPVLVGREGHMPALPQPTQLPGEIRDLVLYQKHSVAHETFGRDVNELVAAIESVLGARRPRSLKRLRIGGTAAVAAALVLLVYQLALVPWLQSPSRPRGLDPQAATVPSDAEAVKSADVAKRRAEAEAKQAADAETARRNAEIEAEQRAEREAKRQAEIEAKKKAEEELAKREVAAQAKRKADEDEAQRKAEAETSRKIEEEAKRRADAEAKNKVDETVPPVARGQWRQFRSAADGFIVLLPQEPKVTSRRINDTKATQTQFLIERGKITYLVSVVHFEDGTGPKNPDQKYFQNLLKNYTEGSKTTLRTSNLTTISGKPGIDGISDTGNLAHQVQIMTAGNRVYMVIYVGPKGQENSADATRFRNSLKADQLIVARYLRGRGGEPGQT